MLATVEAEEDVEVGDFEGPARPCVPTAALPRTTGKVEVLRRRFSLSQSLFSEHDAKLPPDMTWLIEVSRNGVRLANILVRRHQDGGQEVIDRKPLKRRRKRSAAEMGRACERQYREAQRKRRERKRGKGE